MREIIQWMTAPGLFFFFIMIVGIMWILPVSSDASSERPVLAKVKVKDMIENLGVPVHAHLQGKDKSDYVLTITTIGQLKKVGADYTILHETVGCSEGKSYLLAMERFSGLRKKAAGMHQILHDDGRQILLCASPAEATVLSEMGFSICWLNETPMVLDRK